MNEWLKLNKEQINAQLLQVNSLDLGTHTINGFDIRKSTFNLIHSLKCALFPSLYSFSGRCDMYSDPLDYSAHLLNNILLKIYSDYDVNYTEYKHDINKLIKKAETLTVEFLDELVDIRKILSTDIQSALRGDPAAKNSNEVILSYPGIEAIMIYRLAHSLWLKDIPLVPRIMTEYAHSRTGIDIHPGAKIEGNFFIDHGTGVVIGATCIIGNNVKLYQGVTLGAKSFDYDEDGNIKNTKRHPNIEDDVIIYAGATILGGDTVIGKGSIIGGSVWLTESVAPYSKVYNTTPRPIIK